MGSIYSLGLCSIGFYPTNKNCNYLQNNCIMIFYYKHKGGKFVYSYNLDCLIIVKCLITLCSKPFIVKLLAFIFAGITHIIMFTLTKNLKYIFAVLWLTHIPNHLSVGSLALSCLSHGCEVCDKTF